MYIIQPNKILDVSDTELYVEFVLDKFEYLVFTDAIIYYVAKLSRLKQEMRNQIKQHDDVFCELLYIFLCLLSFSFVNGSSLSILDFVV